MRRARGTGRGHDAERISLLFPSHDLDQGQPGWPSHLSTMNVSFHTGPLSEAGVAEALPLVRVTWPGTDLASWRRYIQAFSGNSAAEAGVLAMRDTSDRLCGLLAYNLYRPLGLPSPLLAVPFFTAMDVANSLQAVRLLLGAAERQASALHCSGLEIRLGRGQSQLAERLRSLGLSTEATLLGKTVPREGVKG